MKKIIHNSAQTTKKTSSNSKKVSPTIKKKDLSVQKSFRGTLTPKPKVYYIKWRDAFTETDEWHDSDSITDEDYTCETIGYLLEENKKSNYYSIAGTVTIEGVYTSIINIPKAMVISKKCIKIN